MKIICRPEFKNDLEELLRAFSQKSADEDTACGILIDYTVNNTTGEISASANYLSRQYAATERAASLWQIPLKRQIKRMLKKLLYGLLSDVTGISLPYGSLTGVRPTKLAYELFETEGNYGAAADGLAGYYGVSPEKARLIVEILQNQRGVYRRDTELADVYINIPFCRTRCSYCSFVTTDISRTRKLVEPYTDCLLRELDAVFELTGGRCRALYIGGGTPTAIDDASLERVLRSASRFSFGEFTVEAGRPDTITDGNLALIKDFGANRISINPQTFNQKTLDIIGRGHTVADIYSAYERAAKFGFVINADLIAMLPGETAADFLESVSSCVRLNPDNITVHNLALKRGSRLKLESLEPNENAASAASLITETASAASLMTDGAYKILKAAGYSPYYMYRQKYMSGNLENCGYTKPGRACVYNIDVMEETHCIAAVGAGSISKLVSGEKIERQADVKDIGGYIERIDELIDKKQNFFKGAL
ncbi:MAG: coproporphyrinogen dehydrogenase HemZ [Clostridiales bacterium]|nr:coproporphyrinogen dehydrogenase HemZ [Clostridiales bacterium]